MHTRRKTIFRSSELDEPRRQLHAPWTEDERERQHSAIERIKR